MKKLNVIVPETREKIYAIAAEEFCNYYEKITGYRPERGYDEESDLVVVGGEAIDSYAGTLYEKDIARCEGFEDGKDCVYVRSLKSGDRNVLLLRGGTPRANLYAVYAYFEILGAAWFWDGDVLPTLKREEICDKSVYKFENPRFLYRGTRYFAHRSLKRFQAEFWNYEDWKREIDYLLKIRCNLFMLRIGLDDLFQKAFPESVSYPDEKTKDEYDYRYGDYAWVSEGYNDRRPFWSLQYRGELRKKVLSYAFDRGLIHPEDIGTITHWYSPTPRDFIENEKPEFFDEVGPRDESGKVWDIRKQSQFDNYIKLTETHIKEYGRAEMFHTIGFAERMFTDDREENFLMKKRVYDKFIGYVAEKYPDAPVLIASWDLWLTFTPEEVVRLLGGFDKKRVILLDYTSDGAYENNFTKWNVTGKFPYIFGSFIAYENYNDIVGRYSLTEERLKIAKNDESCIGYVLWPETSHSDILMLEFFAENLRGGEVIPVEKVVENFVEKRYASLKAELKEIWREFLPAAAFIHWNGYKDKPLYHSEYYYFNPATLLERLTKSTDNEPIARDFDFDAAISFAPCAAEVLLDAARVYEMAEGDAFAKKDLIDIARSILARYIDSFLIAEALELCKGSDEKTISVLSKNILSLLSCLRDILAESDEFSLYATLCALEKTEKVFDGFEDTLKNNAESFYCRTNAYEIVKEILIPENERLQKIFIEKSKDENMIFTDEDKKAFSDDMKSISRAFHSKPLCESYGEKEPDFVGSAKAAAKIIQKIKI